MKVIYIENSIEKEEIIKLKNELIMDNKALIPQKQGKISEFLPTKEDIEKFKKNEEKVREQNIEYGKYLESIGFKSNGERNDITATSLYEKRIDENSAFVILLNTDVSLIDYYSNSYQLMFYINQDKISFDGNDDGEHWNYEYNMKTDLGKCKNGSCPENFIREARKFKTLFQNELGEFKNMVINNNKNGD